MRARQLVGPLFVAAGVWCALGDIAPISPDTANVRLAIPASLFWIPLALGLALVVPDWRHRPLSAAPALLAVWPWMPVPTPAVALIWTGRWAWASIGLAVFAAFHGRGSTRSTHGAKLTEQGTDLPEPGRRRQVIAAGVLTLLLSLATAWSLAPRLPGGDEPHYLVITQSLLKDGDIRIANNHAQRDYAAYFGGQLNPDKIQDGKNGEVYSIHAPGTSVLVLPAFAAFGYRGAQLTVLFLAALTGSLVWYGAWLGVRDSGAAWGAWAAVIGSATFLFQSVTIFPDGPGAFVTAAAVVVALRLALGERVTSTHLIGLGALLAALPWLHTRFSVLAAGLGLLMGWLLVRERRPAPEGRMRIAGLFVIPVASAAAWFAFFQIIYGTPNPSAPYGSDPQTSLAYVPGGIVALLLDQQFGLLAYSPILTAAFIGAFVRRPAPGASGAPVFVSRACLAIAFTYFAAVGVYWMWWAGVPATPARFASAALPLFAVPVAVAWSRASGVARAIWRVLLTATLVVTGLALGVDRGALAWNNRASARAAWIDWMGSAADIPRALPSFFWRLDPGHVSSELGFGLHAALTVGVVVVLGVASRRLRSRPALAASAWLAAGLMAAVQAGWWLDHVRPLEPSRAQLAVLARSAGRQGSVQIAPLAWRTGPHAPSVLRIQAPRVDVDNSGPLWGAFTSVPPGVYRVEILASIRLDGRARVVMGRTEVGAFAAADRSYEFRLPGGAAALSVVPDEGIRRDVAAIQLVPVRLFAPLPAFARAITEFGALRVDFLDDNVFVEPDAFWVKGQATAGFVVSSSAGKTATLDVSNGALANALTVEIAGGRQTLKLRASESRTIPVTLDASGTAHVQLTSESGFRPSDMGASRDARYLGVRVSVR